MVSISIGEILVGWEGNPAGARIYLIRDDKIVFYIGLLQWPILDHLREHCWLGEGGWPADKVGKVILDNAPSSNGWTVDLLSLEDCDPIIKEVQPLIKRIDAARALYCLTLYYRPVLNEKDNPNPTPLPERYKK